MQIEPFAAQAVFTRLRDAGVDPNPEKVQPNAHCIGAGFPGADKAREAKAKTEKTREAAFEAVAALEASTDYVSAADYDKEMAKLVPAWQADVAAATALRTAIENGRDDAESAWCENKASGVARSQELLEKLTQELFGIALAERVIAAARSNNAADRHAPMPEETRTRLPGGQALHALTTAVDNINLPSYVVLSSSEWKRWRDGAQNVHDVFGEPMPPGMPPARVRRSYSPAARVLHPAEVRGGVA
jgi:hypothetical protein